MGNGFMDKYSYLHFATGLISYFFENEYYLEATKNGPNGFPLGNQTRIYLRNNHLQYALTWFMIACGLVGVFFFANIKKIK